MVGPKKALLILPQRLTSNEGFSHPLFRLGIGISALPFALQKSLRPTISKSQSQPLIHLHTTRSRTSIFDFNISTLPILHSIALMILRQPAIRTRAIKSHIQW